MKLAVTAAIFAALSAAPAHAEWKGYPPSMWPQAAAGLDEYLHPHHKKPAPTPADPWAAFAGKPQAPAAHQKQAAQAPVDGPWEFFAPGTYSAEAFSHKTAPRMIYRGVLPAQVPGYPNYAYAQMPDGSIGMMRIPGSPDTPTYCPTTDPRYFTVCR